MIQCSEPGCNERFPKNPYSSIQKKYCFTCQKKKDIERKIKNKNLLAQSTFAGRSGKSEYKTGGIATKKGRSSKATKTNKTARQRARDNADLWFSRYIRIKYAYRIMNGDVFCRCIVDPSIIKQAKHMDNGHFFSRKFLLTRYEEDNCRPQNRSSNRFSGEADHYTFQDNLLRQIGEKRFNRLDELRKQEGSDTLEFYQKQASKYKRLVAELVRVNQINKWW